MSDKTLFQKILDREIPAPLIYEDDLVAAFHDIAPQAKIHALVIPKGAYVSWADFSARANDKEIADFVRTVGLTAKDLGVEDSGYRLVANHGPDSHQEVPHLHVHMFGGRQFYAMVPQ